MCSHLACQFALHPVHQSMHHGTSASCRVGDLHYLMQLQSLPAPLAPCTSPCTMQPLPCTVLGIHTTSCSHGSPFQLVRLCAPTRAPWDPCLMQSWRPTLPRAAVMVPFSSSSPVHRPMHHKSGLVQGWGPRYLIHGQGPRTSVTWHCSSSCDGAGT